MVSDDGMDARLVVHVHDELLIARGSHHIRSGLVSSLAYEEILHTKTMYPYIISRMCNERRIKQYSASKTYPQLLLHLHRLVVEFLTVPIYYIGCDDVMVEGVGWTRHSSVLNKSREVFPTQKADDAIGIATVTCPIDKEKVLISIMNLNI
jgi:hypothetical protein